MKIITILILILTPFLGFSQQNLKKITDLATKTRIELYTFRNGDTSENVVGNDNFTDELTHSYKINFLNEDGTLVYTPVFTLDFEYVSSSDESETICNGTFDPDDDGHGGYFKTFHSNGGDVWRIKVLELPYKLDALEDNNDLFDLYKVIYEIPKTMIDGSVIPINTWATCLTRAGRDGELLVENKRIGFKFNGTTWVEQTHDWAGNDFDAIEEVCSNLAITELENTSQDVRIYPIPASDYLIIQDSQNSATKFTYQIFDLIGRVIKAGESAYYDKIGIRELIPGQYIIQIIDERGKIIRNKIIKK